MLRRRENVRLRLAQCFLLPGQTALHTPQRLLFGSQRLPMLLQRARGSGQPLGDDREFLLRHTAALLGLRNVAQRAAVLPLNFLQSLFVEMNPAFVPVKLAFQFESAML